MEEFEEQEIEQAPECVESKLACDLAMIPVLGVLFYVLFENIASFKLGTVNASKSFWLREGVRRLWIYTFKPFYMAIKLLLLCAVAGLVFGMIVFGGFFWVLLLLVLIGYLRFGLGVSSSHILSQVSFGLVVITIAVVLFVPASHGHQRYANDNEAQATLKAIVTAQATYITQYKRYASSITELVSSGFLRRDALARCAAPGIDSGNSSGYIYQMTSGRDWSDTNFYVRCRPVSEHAGVNCYSTDNNGRIVTTEAYQ